MKCRIRPASVVLIAVLAVLSSTLTACAKEEAQPTEARPPYCATQDGGPNAKFWRLVEESCRVTTDGDVGQARALRLALSGLDAEQVAAFHRTFVRVSNSLYTQEIGAVADRACAPGIGLGDDLFTDFRSWVIAHGQVAYTRVVERPETLNAFPDIANGCGMGEPFGYAALEVYVRKTGRKPGNTGLPILEPTTAPAE